MTTQNEGQRQGESQDKYVQVIARAWADEGFKQRLLANPGAVLQQEGIAIPTGITVKAVENTSDVFHLVIPPKPAGELSDEMLQQLAGGYHQAPRPPGMETPSTPGFMPMQGYPPIPGYPPQPSQGFIP